MTGDMTPHERALDRARDLERSQRAAAERDAQQPVEQRKRYDVIAHLRRLDQACKDEREKLACERQRNRETRKAVIRFGRQVRITFWLCALLMAAMFGLGFYFIERNKEAVEVGCLVVVQVIRDSGANSGKPRETPAGKAQARITTAFYEELLKGMTPARRVAVLRDQEIVRRAGGSIPEPRCAEIADDPAKVRRETLQEP